ncbi:MAG: hypothetical protein KDE55_15880 [Novosphingobium sp.]|nr:hypothetical protein [Novosphingobium sp.]
MTTPAKRCPVQSDRDDRKSVALEDSAAKPMPGYAPISHFGFARDVLRSPAVKQGMDAHYFADKDPARTPVIFLDGESHEKRRAQLARYFTPRAIKDRHRLVMERTTTELMAQLRLTGRGQLDVPSLRLACDVAAEIVGLTSTDASAMPNRLHKKFRASSKVKRPGPLGKLGRLEDTASTIWFYRRDVVPAIRHRQATDMDDVIFSWCARASRTRRYWSSA